MMDITCINQGGERLLIENITELAQVYRFDQFLVRFITEDDRIECEIPSVEWLEEFTRLLKVQRGTLVKKVLRGSGFYFLAEKTNNGVVISFDSLNRGMVSIELTDSDACNLHQTVLSAVLNPFIEQGGKVDRLSDLELFEHLC